MHEWYCMFTLFLTHKWVGNVIVPIVTQEFASAGVISNGSTNSVDGIHEMSGW